MKLSLVKPYRSLTNAPISEELADFVVLTGPNGSGKTNLLEAIAVGAVQIEELDIEDSQRQLDIRHYPLGQLLVDAGARQASQIQESWLSIYNLLEQIRGEYAQNIPSDQLAAGTDQQKREWIRTRLIPATVNQFM